MILMATHMNLILPCVLAVPSTFGAGSHKSHDSLKLYVAKDDLKLITPPLPAICRNYRSALPCQYLGTWPSLSLFNVSSIL